MPSSWALTSPRRGKVALRFHTIDFDANTDGFFRQLFRVLSVLISEELYLFASNLFSQTYESLDLTITGIQTSLTYQPISVAMANAGDATGGHALGVPRKPHACELLAIFNLDCCIN